MRESAWQALFQHAPFGIAINRFSDGCYLDANPAIEHALGYKKEDLIGKPADSFHSDSYRKDNPVVAKQLMVEGFTGIKNAKIKRKDGSFGEILYSVATFQSGDDINTVSMIIDITEKIKIQQLLKQSEAMLESFYQAVPIGLALLKDRMILTANESLAEITGVPCKCADPEKLPFSLF